MPNKRNNRRKQRIKASSKREDEIDWQKSKLKPRNSKSALIFVHGKDVTLTEFADNASSRALSGRMSKAVLSPINKEIKQVESASAVLAATAEEEIIDDWYERTFSDDEDHDENIKPKEDGVHDTNTSVTSEGNIVRSEHVHLRQPQRLKDSKAKGPSNDCVGTVYPSVIWYLVSAFIYPEDIATFASLCHDTYAVTNTAGFWRRLYFRYYTKNSARLLPKELQATSIQRMFGLHSLVIRSLQFLYPPFVGRNALQKNTKFTSSDENLQSLTGTVFMYHVSKRKGPNFVYYLKFHQPDHHSAIIETVDRDPDIFVNSHSGQCILMIVSKQTHNLEPERIMGKELAYASLGISTGMSYQRLKMEFQEPMTRRGQLKIDQSARRHDRTYVVLDPVVCTRVFHWWHPQFHEEFRITDSNDSMNNNLSMWNAT